MSTNPTLSERFESWWAKHGQFCRAGGGDYEKCFAYAAWVASHEESAHNKRVKELEVLENTAPIANEWPVNDAIARAKEILSLVDEYHEKPTNQTRTKLRMALHEQFLSLLKADIGAATKSLINEVLKEARDFSKKVTSQNSKLGAEAVEINGAITSALDALHFEFTMRLGTRPSKAKDRNTMRAFLHRLAANFFINGKVPEGEAISAAIALMEAPKK